MLLPLIVRLLYVKYICELFSIVLFFFFKEKKKLEAANQAKVLKELKTVITVKAEEMRQRELKAINKMKNKSETVSVTESETKPTIETNVNEMKNKSETINLKKESETDCTIETNVNTIKNESESISVTESETKATIETNINKIKNKSEINSESESTSIKGNETEFTNETETLQVSECGDISRTDNYVSESTSNTFTNDLEKPENPEEFRSQEEVWDDDGSSPNSLSVHEEISQSAIKTPSNSINDELEANESHFKEGTDDEQNLLSIKEKLEKLHGSDLSFTASLANMAAARSLQINKEMKEETFGDEDSDVEEVTE